MLSPDRYIVAYMGFGFYSTVGYWLLTRSHRAWLW